MEMLLQLSVSERTPASSEDNGFLIPERTAVAKLR